MASFGNNPFDTLAGTCNNTLTQTTVSASGRDTDHIHSTRETTLGGDQEAAADVGAGRQQHTRQGAEMLAKLRAPVPSGLHLENSIGEVRALLLNIGWSFSGPDADALQQVSVWLLGRGAKPTEAADFLSSVIAQEARALQRLLVAVAREDSEVQRRLRGDLQQTQQATTFLSADGELDSAALERWRLRRRHARHALLRHTSHRLSGASRHLFSVAFLIPEARNTPCEPLS